MALQGQDSEQQAGSQLTGKRPMKHRPQGLTLSFVDNSEEKIEKLVDMLKELISMAQQGMQELTKWQRAQLYLRPRLDQGSDVFKNMIFGTFDYMRAELEVVYSAEQFWVNSHDNSKIDCMIIPSAVDRKNDDPDDRSRQAPAAGLGPGREARLSLGSRSSSMTVGAINSSRSPGGAESNPFEKLEIDNKSTNFVLFCNPNAVFYEYLNYQTEWMNFYTRVLGMNMIVFNYRGYGRSDMSGSSKFWQKYLGVLNPHDVVQDAEIILEYAIE